MAADLAEIRSVSSFNISVNYSLFIALPFVIVGEGQTPFFKKNLLNFSLLQALQTKKLT